MLTYMLTAALVVIAVRGMYALARPSGILAEHTAARAGSVMAIGAVSALIFTDVAHAQGVDGANTIAEIRLSSLTVTLIVAVFIPIVTAIVTKLDTSSQVKGVVTLVLNLVNAAVVGAVIFDGTAVFSEEVLIAALIGMAISVASYLGFYKPVDINAKMLPEQGL